MPKPKRPAAVLTKPKRPPALRPQAVSRPKRSGTRTILLVEDDADIRRMMQLVLEHAGYRVVTATDGNAAFRLCLEGGGTIDALITDIVVPGINGVDLIELFRAQWPQTKAILMSGQIGRTMLQERQISVPFLTKPVSNDVLLQTLRELLQH